MNSPAIIAKVRDKCKGFVGRVPRDVFIISILILVSLLSFGLGYLAGMDASGETKSSISFETAPLATTTVGQGGQVVASKSGTKYYLPSCASANRISEANKVWFSTSAAATAAGYTPAANCPGL